MKPKVYVAGPFSSDPIGNTRYAIELANNLLNMGYAPFVPHLTMLWHFHKPRPYEEWLKYDNEWLVVCDCVLRFSGESPGADKEVILAESLGIPVYYSPAELVKDMPSENHEQAIAILNSAGE